MQVVLYQAYYHPADTKKRKPSCLQHIILVEMKTQQILLNPSASVVTHVEASQDRRKRYQ